MKEKRNEASGAEIPTQYIVRSSRSQLPSRYGDVYRRIAVMEVEHGTTPAMISSRARGVRRIVKTWERQYVGTTKNSAFFRALTEAQQLAAELNAGVNNTLGYAN